MGIIKELDIINGVVDEMMKMTHIQALAVVAMIMEEECKKRGESMLDSIDLLHRAAIDVDAICGKY